jgi:hypothetical protein
MLPFGKVIMILQLLFIKYLASTLPRNVSHNKPAIIGIQYNPEFKRMKFLEHKRIPSRKTPISSERHFIMIKLCKCMMLLFDDVCRVEDSLLQNRFLLPHEFQRLPQNKCYLTALSHGL